jgi:hypothetical protein
VPADQKPAASSSAPKAILPAPTATTSAPTAIVFPPASLARGCADPDSLPRSTRWYRKKREEKKAAGELVRQYKVRRTTKVYTCSRCGRSRTPDTHRQYYGQWYCPSTATESFEEWRSSREKRRQEEKLWKKQ